MSSDLVVASIGGWDKPSTVYRIGPLIRNGYQADIVSVRTVPTETEIESLAARGGGGSVLILRRVLPAPPDMARLAAAFRAIVFDMDDAIYAAPPRVGEARAVGAMRAAARLVLRGSRYASSRAKPLRATLERVDACVVGNSILAQFAAGHAPRIIEIPTTTRPVLNELLPDGRQPAIAWLGVAANLQYLQLVASALRALQRRVPFRLRVVSSSPPPELGVPTDFISWSPDAAREALMTATVGIAPLTDDPWTRGKCAFRAIQYGAHALATVASPVGITPEVVIPGKTGYLAKSQQEWEDALARLLCEPREALEMGRNALDLVTRRYSDAVAVERWRDLLTSLGTDARSS